MVGKCANSWCPTTRHHHEGKLFRLDIDLGNKAGGDERRTEYIWLCAPCAQVMHPKVEVTGNLRHTPRYRQRLSHYEKTRPTAVSIGELHKPSPYRYRAPGRQHKREGHPLHQCRRRGHTTSPNHPSSKTRFTSIMPEKLRPSLFAIKGRTGSFSPPAVQQVRIDLQPSCYFADDYGRLRSEMNAAIS
jgi:hypothetical protein